MSYVDRAGATLSRIARALARRPEPVSERPPSVPGTIASTRKQVAFGLISLAVFLGVLYLIRDMMGAFVLGGLLAFVIEPTVSRLTRVGVPRPLAILTALLVLLGALAGLFTLVVPLFTEEIPLLQAQAPAVAAAAQAQLSHLQGHSLTVFGYKVDLMDTTSMLSRNVGGFLLGQWGTAIGLGIAALGTVAQMGLMLLIAFLVSLDAPRLGGFVRRLSPTRYRADVDAILGEVLHMLHGYVRGQLVVASLIGVISGVAVWAIGLKYALALGLLAGVTALVPYLGPYLGAIPAVVVALSTGWQQAILVAVAYVIISNVVLNFMYPKIVGDAVKLPALVVIVAFIAGFSLAGILGMFVAVPVAATIRIIYDHVHPRLFGDAVVEQPETPFGVAPAGATATSGRKDAAPAAPSEAGR
jgi:predicted PurR-regulated permease PerM